MTKSALFIQHKTLPGQRDAVRAVWEKHMRPAIESNRAHEAYFYCYDDQDPDRICVFQQYGDAEAPGAFMSTASYAAYIEEVTPLLAGSPEIRAATPQWFKGATG